MTALTISQVATRFRLSRSALLYYDSIGLLTPAGRSASGYRLYSEADIERMEQIQRYREAGMPLDVIGELLSEKSGRLRQRLDERLEAINREISQLRRQQQVIVKLLQGEQVSGRTRVISKKQWVDMLRASGLDEAGMKRWHVEFESTSPEAHQDFLESLGVNAHEIEAIRRWSRGE